MKKVFLLVSVVVGLLICVSANVEATDAVDIPSGGIIPYKGAWNFDGTGLGTGTLEGWALCNGNNGTPNLTDRFVYAVTAEAQLGGTGGTTSHTHGMGKREVRLGPDTGDCSYGSTTIGWREACEFNYYTFDSYSDSGSYSHSFDNTSYTGNVVKTYLQTRAGSVTDSADTRPSYYKLAFIMKIGPDITPPTVISVNPSNNSTGVAPSTNISVTFSEAMNQATAQGAFSISPSVAGAFSWNGNIMTFDPTSNLALSTLYTCTVSTAAQDLAGNSLASQYQWSFTTAAPPTCTTNNATNVTYNSATLNGTVNPNGLNVTSCYFDYGTTESYGSTANVSLPGSGESPVSVSANIGGSGVSPVTFNYTGGQQTWDVPSGVTSIVVDVKGAQGGTSGSNTGGLGGRTQATLAVTPGSTLYIYVGEQPTTYAAGYNGGGHGNGYANCRGGGGASDIRSGGTALGNRVAVAGGGGGASVSWTVTGGAGGGPTGGDGTSSNGTAYCGKGATQSAGGAKETAYTGTSAEIGSLGLGGNAGTANQNGGAGGGGYYGGGGGDAGGGGGGSSWSNGSSITYTGGYQSGNGQVIITPSATPLSANTTYNFRVVATNAGGTTNGNNVTFTTATTETYSYTGAQETFTVPANVTSITVDVYGAQGGNDTVYSLPGGYGARMKASFTVTPGWVFNVRVGGQGTNGPSYGGGGGGGSYFVRNTPEPYIIAGGGGGGGYNYTGTPAGLVGTTSTTGNTPTVGGAGGVGPAGGGVGGGSYPAGGGGGYSGNGGNSGSSGGYSYTNGSAGGTGGSYPAAGGYGGGGGGNVSGGGGGGYGGGGGGTGNSPYYAGGGGGSYINPAGTSITQTSGARSGNGLISITYSVAPAFDALLLGGD